MNETNKTQTKPTYENKLVEAGSLWKKVSNKGTPYIFIKIMVPDSLGNPQPMLLRGFSNKYKTPENTVPDWILYLADDKAVTTKPVKTEKPAPKLKKEVEAPQESEADTDDSNL